MKTKRKSRRVQRRAPVACSACRHYVFMVISHNCVHGFVDPKTCGRFTPNAEISGGIPYAESDCSACHGGGWVYGPTNAYPITEAQEAPEVLQCQKCNGTGKKPNAELRRCGATPRRSDDASTD